MRFWAYAKSRKAKNQLPNKIRYKGEIASCEYDIAKTFASRFHGVYDSQIFNATQIHEA